ncbi:MAG TPA: FKBP-type peptidyl-prolyl cis-trans isomerase [Caulobacter sp.]|nr:FKBP-type peptidyl-prolyl cis-trans isomerase [Caulobacter sp.]
MLRRTLLIGLAGLALAACQKKADPALLNASAANAKAFMDKTAKEPGVLKLPSGVLYKVERAGPAGGRSPGPRDDVKVHYEGKLVSGEVFDSSYERGSPAVMNLGGLIPAWQEALVKMKPGDSWILYVPPELGYGEDGAGPIPPNSVLIFKIELIDSLSSGAPVLG